MVKETQEKEIGEMLSYIVEHMATKEDLAEIRREMATKDDLFTLQTQVNSIEREIKGMRHGRLELRVGKLEEKVFGKSCA